MIKYNNILTTIYLVSFFAFPRLNIKVAGLNLYFIDCFSAFLIVISSNYKHQYNFSTIVKLILLIFIIHQSFYLFLTGEILTVLITTIRYSIPIFSFFYIFPLIFESYKSNPSLVINSIKYSILFSSLCSILFSISVTRPIISLLYSMDFLSPTGGKAVIKRELIDNSIRTYSLLGISNLTGIILLFGLGIIIFLEKNKRLNFKDYLIRAVIFLGAITSYSRTIFLSLFIVLFVTILYSRTKHSIKLSFLTLFIGIIFSWSFLISDTKYFNFKRIDDTVFDYKSRTSPKFYHSLSERYNSYLDPFNDMMLNSSYFFIGSTINKLKLKNIFFLNTKEQANDHSLFGMSFYIHGLIVCVLYSSLLLVLITNTMKSIFKFENVYFFSIPVIVWCLTTHAVITNPQGSVIFYLTIFTLLNYNKLIKN